MSVRESSQKQLERGREEYERHDWAAAYASLSAADRTAPLGAEDLERMAFAGELSGDSEAFLRATERIYEVRLAEGASRAAARAAFWVGFRAVALGQPGRANAWLDRAQRLVDGESAECAERGFLLLPVAQRHQMAGRTDDAHAVAVEATAIGDRVGDADLSAYGRNLQGRALVRLGHVDRGLTLLDESMLMATASKLSPVFTGLIYCGMIASCQRVYAIARAREWTAALSAWCESEPRAVTFQGACLVHRAELLQIGGSWPEALDEARDVCSRGRPHDRPSLAEAYHQSGEIHRLRGAYDEAERHFREASVHGHEPQPGLALLCLVRGQREAAASAIRRVVAETRDPLAQAKLLPAAIEIHLAAGDVARAREACARLEEIAGTFATEALGALAAHGRGRIHLADGDAAAALGPLRRAFWVWHKIDAPYLAARVRVDLGRACLALGDGEGARMELEVARAVFEELGALPDVAALETVTGAPPARAQNGLTQRELQVLRFVAAGKTNKAIARELFLSEKTIDRHVSNIFVKANVGSRAAATAWAYEHDLV